MDERALEALQKMGLDPKAASIYLALLRRPKLTVSQISRETGIKRATCYEYVDELLAKDFVTREPSGKRTFYSAVDPKRLYAIFRRDIAKIEGSIMEMSSLHENAVNRPKVTYFEGKRQLRLIYDDMFKTVGDVYSIFPAETFFKHFTLEDYSILDKSLSDHALKSKDLFVVDRHYRDIQEVRERNGSENKLSKRLPNSFESKVDVLIYSDKVALISLRDLSAIVIENSDIAELFRNLHATIWKHV